MKSSTPIIRWICKFRFLDKFSPRCCISLPFPHMKIDNVRPQYSITPLLIINTILVGFNWEITCKQFVCCVSLLRNVFHIFSTILHLYYNFFLNLTTTDDMLIPKDDYIDDLHNFNEMIVSILNSSKSVSWAFYLTSAALFRWFLKKV